MQCSLVYVAKFALEALNTPTKLYPAPFSLVFLHTFFALFYYVENHVARGSAIFRCFAQIIQNVIQVLHVDHFVGKEQF